MEWASSSRMAPGPMLLFRSLAVSALRLMDMYRLELVEPVAWEVLRVLTC